MHADDNISRISHSSAPAILCNCFAGSDFRYPTLLRTTIQHRLAGHVAIEEFYRIVGARRERDVASQRTVGEFAFNMREDAGAIRCHIQDDADTKSGHDLVR